MKNGYKIFWTPNSKNELKETLEYLEKNFTKKEIKKLVQNIESITELISRNKKASFDLEKATLSVSSEHSKFS